MIETCPRCGGAGVPLLFGLPVFEARAAAEDGKLALGGCIMPEQAPRWQCPRHHRWHSADEDAWQDRVLEALSAYGYCVPPE